MRNRTRLITLALAILPAACMAAAPARTGSRTLAAHVVIIGVDGMRADAIQNGATPWMEWLMQHGAYSLHALSVMPSVSAPNWASMIKGAGPEQHGIGSNDRRENKTPNGSFPSIFAVLRQQEPRSVIACLFEWGGIGDLLEPNVLDVVQNGKGAADTMQRAIAVVDSRRPTLTFIQLDHVDHAGHTSGYGSAEYIQAVSEADRLIGQMLDELQKAGIQHQTVVIVAADHGGIRKRHGGATTEERETPWIIWGPGIAAGREISSTVNVYDTAATVAYVLGLKPPHDWIGRPVREAFASAN